MNNWVEYKFPGIESSSFKKYVDGEASFEFTPGGFLKCASEAGVPYLAAADAVSFAVNLNQMIPSSEFPRWRLVR